MHDRQLVRSEAADGNLKHRIDKRNILLVPIVQLTSVPPIESMIGERGTLPFAG